MMTSDHSFIPPPATKHRLRWRTQRQKWKLIVKLMCHRQHCHRQRHLLLMRVRIHLSERRSPIGCTRSINRLDTVTIARIQTSSSPTPHLLVRKRSWCNSEIDGMHRQHPVTGCHARYVSSWLMLAHVLRWSPSLRKLVNVPLATMRLWSARNRC